MMLNILPLPVNDILLYLNLFFIALILIGGIIGFVRGTRKSLVHLLSWVVLFVIGILLMKPILKMVLNYDLSSFGWSVSGININTLNQFLQDFLVTTNPDLFTPEMLVEGTNVYALLVGIINFVYKIVYWLVWLILSMIFTRLINFIVWIFVKPKKIIIRGKKRRPKKTLGTRFGGLGIGAFRGLLCTLLIGFILAGVSSIASSLNTISSDESDLTVVCVDDKIVLLSDSSSTNDIDSYIDEYSEIIDLLEGYRSTVPGQIFGVLKFGEEKTPVDEQLFDYFFSIESNTGSLRIRAELVKVANALNNDAVKTLLSNGFDLETIASLDRDSLIEVIDIISSLDTIKVVVPVGLDLIMYTDILADQLGNEFGDIKQALVDNIEKFNNINYGNDIQKLGYALVDVVDLFGSGITDITTVNFLELDVQKVEKIFNELSEMQLLDLVAPIAVTYLLSTEEIKNAIAEAGFTLEDLKIEELLKEKEDLFSHEFKMIPKIYEALVATGISYNEETISFENINPDKMDGLVNTLFDSYIIDNSISVVASTLYTSFMPDEYKDIISLEELKSTNWKEEFSPLLTAAAILLQYNIIDSEDPLATLSTIDDEDFERIGSYLAKSNLIFGHMNEIIDLVIDSLEIEGLELSSLDSESGETWSEKEVVSIFKAVKVIVKSGILTSEDPLESMKSLSNETIDELALNLSSSIFFTKNLGSVVDQLMSSLSTDITLEGLDESNGEEWDYLEINSLLKTIKVFADINILGDNPLESIKTMTDSTIQELAENISNSNYITKNLNNLLDGFDDELGITIENLAKEDWTKNETYSVFKSITIIASMVDGDTVNIENFLNLSEKDLDIILESKLLRNSLKSLLVDKAKEGGELELLKGVYEEETYYTWDDQVDKAISNINSGTLQITNVVGARKYIIYKNGIYFTSVSDNSPINLQTIEGYEYSTLDKFNVVAIKTYGELRCVFNAITCLEINDVENFDIDLRNVINKKDTLFESYILVETLIDQIRKLSKDNPDGMLIIPEEFKENGTGNWRDLDGNVGELSKIINALDIVLGISTSIDPVLISTINTDNISLKTIVDQKDDILASSIISYTIVDLFQESTSSSEIVLPSEYSSDDYSPWLDNGDIKGELSIIFDIINEVVELPDSGFEIDVETISMKNIITNKDNILKSAVLTATLVNIINDLGTDSGSSSAILTIPDDLKISDTNSWQTDYNKWKNIYNSDGTVKQAGELSKLINSLDLALGITSNDVEIDITNISEEDISLKRIVDNRTEVFESDILTVTVVELIKSINTAEEPNNIIIPIEYQNDYEVWRGSDGELCVILETLDVIGLIPATGIDVDVSSINIASLMTNKEKLIKSVILTATIADKITGMSDVLSIPDDYIINASNPSWENDYNNWKGQEGELYKIISGLEYALIDTNINVDSIDLDNISLKNIINNKENVFKSAILTNTVIDSIKDLSSSGAITVPVELNENAEWIGADKELFNILDAIDAMDIIPTNGFNIDVNTLTINSILSHTDTILKSIILSATIINMINDLDTVITIPTEYQINNSSPSWEIDYEEWRTKDELKKFINAISVALTESETKVTELTMDTISLSNIIDQRNEVFKSDILTATVVSEIQKLDGTVSIPSDYKGSYKDWQGVNGELDLLLAGLSCVVEIPETGFNISTDNIELNNIIIKSDEILKSAILTATIVDQIVALDTTLTIPNAYKINNTKTWDDYEVWKNKYDINMNVTSRGELSNMLGSVDCVLGISTDESPVTINSLSSKLADFTIKGIVDQRLQILKSYVISATIIDKVTALDGSGIYIPSQYKITQPSDYDKWMNNYSSDVVVEGELSRVLVSVNALIGADDTSTSISDINIGNSINGMIKSINNDTSKQYRNALLGSNVVSETIITNIATFQSVEDYIETAETKQKSFGNNISLIDSNNRSDWYLNEADGNVQEKELWNILTSVSLLLGSAVDFSDVNDFSIDDLISSSMKITYNDNYDVMSSDVEILLKSYIIEHIFAQLTNTLLVDTFNGMISFGGFNYYSNDPKVKAGDEYDLRTFLESFYIMNKYIDYSSITSSFDNLDVLANNDEKLNDLAAGMVISRTFRNSLATLYDAIFAAYYASLAMSNPLLIMSHPISGMPKFDQTRFNVSDTLTKVNAHDNFVVDYTNIYSEYHALEG